MEINRIYDLIKRCQNTGSPTFSDFLDYGELIEVRRGLGLVQGVKVVEFLAFSDDERRMVGFFPDDLALYMSDDDIQTTFPVLVLKIEPAFEGQLEHRALMGTVLGLGLDRRLFGDMIIVDNIGYILCHERSGKVVLDELISLGRTQVSVSILNLKEARHIKPNTELIKTTVASLRLDGVIKALGGISRTDAAGAISRGHVKVNQVVVLKNHLRLAEGDIISIKGKGKYRIRTIGHRTKKDRIVIHIDRYI